MSKRSTATAREQPVAGVTTAAGRMQVHAETFTIETAQRVQLIDVTDAVTTIVGNSGIQEGSLSLASLHTTATVIVNEFQRALLADIRAFLERLVERDAEWLHNDPRHSDCDRRNADAHLRALLLGHGVTLQVSGGEVVPGQWQRILLAELDGPRARTLRASVMGV
jgi:secondary thiamine-phosphate synthase enzyme